MANTDYPIVKPRISKQSIRAARKPRSLVADVLECTCEICGCTDSNACEGGCSWISVNRKTGIGLCSRCGPVSTEEKMSAHPLTSLRAIYRKIMPRDASMTQIKEMRRAFYTGAVSMFELIVKSSSKDEDRAIALMTTIDDEVKAFLGTIGEEDDQN